MEFLSVSNFMWLQILLVVGGVIYLVHKAPQAGVRLRWRSRRGRSAPLEMSRPTQFWGRGKGMPQPRPQTPPADGSRSLNIYFNFNGHSWDAYEVLGVPAGSGWESVEKAHATAIAQSTSEAREFYDHALKAIRLHLEPN